MSNTSPTDAEIVEEYRRAHFSKKQNVRLKDFRRNVLITLANMAPGFWGSRVKNPLFIIGCARSGTTILETLMAQHPDVANWSEASVLWDPSGYYWSISKRETPPLWVDPEAFTVRWRKDNRSRDREIRASFGLFQSVRNRPALLNKNPENQFRIPDILEIFPEAHIVHIVRDGRAMVYSALKRMRRKVETWPDFHRVAGVDYSKEEMAVMMSRFWLQAVNEVSRQDRALGLKSSGRMIELRYEDLCSDREPVLRQICDLASLDMARFPKSMWDISLSSQNFKWKQGLAPELIAEMNEAMQPALRDWGYE